MTEFSFKPDLMSFAERSFNEIILNILTKRVFFCICDRSTTFFGGRIHVELLVIKRICYLSIGCVACSTTYQEFLSANPKRVIAEV